MTLVTRRFAFALFASALAAPLAVRTALAQGMPTAPGSPGATVGPAGAIPSTTAPSNSQGTPAGGTGVVGGGTTEPAPTRRARRRSRTRHARHRTQTPSSGSNTQSQ